MSGLSLDYATQAEKLLGPSVPPERQVSVFKTRAAALRRAKKEAPAQAKREPRRTRPSARKPAAATLAIKPLTARELLAQRETELDLVNAIQQGLAAKLVE